MWPHFKKLWSTTLPILISSVFSYLAVIINTHTLGKNNTQALYLMSLFMPLNLLLVALFESFRSSVMTSVSTAVLNGRSALFQLLINWIALALVVIAVIGFLFLFLNNGLATLLNIPVQFQAYFYTFSIKMILSSGLMLVSIILVSAFFALGSEKEALCFNFAAFVLLITLTYLFERFAHCGLDALVFANLIAAACVIVWAAFSIKNLMIADLLSLKLSQRPAFGVVQQLTGVGVPVFLSYSLVFFGTFIVTMILSTFNYHVVAAYSIAIRIQSLIMMPALAVGAATALLINRNADHSLCDENKYLWSSVLVNAAIYAVFTTLLFYHYKIVVEFLSSAPNIIALAGSYFKLMSFSYLGLAIALSLLVIMESTGQGKIALFINTSILILELAIGGVLTVYTHNYLILFKTIRLFNWILAGVVFGYVFYTKRQVRSV